RAGRARRDARPDGRAAQGRRGNGCPAGRNASCTAELTQAVGQAACLPYDRDRVTDKSQGTIAMFEINAGLPFDPKNQRYRDYARQRQMTLADLLLENRIVFLGSSPETGGQAAITDYLANVTIQKLLFLQYENRNQEIHFYINCPGGSVTA